MRAWWGAALVGLVATSAVAQSTARQDGMIASYFAIWDDDGQVTAENVAKLYAPRLTYYGHPMTRESLLQDKRNFIRQWPSRRYAVEPGSAAKHCAPGGDPCVVTATLVWRLGGASRTRSGRSRVSLTLAHADGGLKIIRESGVTLH